MHVAVTRSCHQHTDARTASTQAGWVKLLNIDVAPTQTPVLDSSKRLFVFQSQVGWNLVRHFKWSGRKARLAQLWNLTVTDTEKKNFVDAFKVSLIPRAFLISYSTPTLLAGLALKVSIAACAGALTTPGQHCQCQLIYPVAQATHAGPGHSRGHSRFDAGYLCCCLFWSARCGAKSICQRTGRLSGWSIFLVAASGGYFVTGQDLSRSA